MSLVQEIQHLLMLYLSAILLFAGVFTSAWNINWRVNKIDIRGGLFKHCVEDHCVNQDGDKSVKGMELVGLFTAVFCSICMTVHLPMKNKSNKVIKILPQLTFYTSIAGAGLIFLGCAIYSFDKFGDSVYPGYSFVLTLVGGVFLIGGGAASSRK